MIEHYVLIKAKPGREEDVSNALRDFAHGVVEEAYVLELTFGRNLNSRSGDMGWTHGLLARLASMDVLQNDYWRHAAHTALLEVLDATTEERFALDYETPLPR